MVFDPHWLWEATIKTKRSLIDAARFVAVPADVEAASSRANIHPDIRVRSGTVEGIYHLEIVWYLQISKNIPQNHLRIVRHTEEARDLRNEQRGATEFARTAFAIWQKTSQMDTSQVCRDLAWYAEVGLCKLLCS